MNSTTSHATTTQTSVRIDDHVPELFNEKRQFRNTCAVIATCIV